MAAAVIFDPAAKRLKGLNDSKLLTESQREDLFPLIQERAIAWAIGRADVAEIDTINIGFLILKLKSNWLSDD